MRRWMGGLALVGVIAVAGGAAARLPQEDLGAADKAIADLARMRELVRAQQTRAREALVQIRRQQASLAAAAEQLEKAIRQADAAFARPAATDVLPEIKDGPKLTPAPAPPAATGNVVLHLAAQGWRISAGSFQIDGAGAVVLAPFTASVKADKAERRYTAARAVLRLDQAVRNVASMGDRTILSMQLSGDVKVRTDAGYLLDADKLDVTFAAGTPTLTANGKVHFQTGDLPAGAMCVRAERVLIADSVWFAGKATVQTAEARGEGDRGRYDAARNCLHLEADAADGAALRHKGRNHQGKRVVLDFAKGQVHHEP